MPPMEEKEQAKVKMHQSKNTRIEFNVIKKAQSYSDKEKNPHDHNDIHKMCQYIHSFTPFRY